MRDRGLRAGGDVRVLGGCGCPRRACLGGGCRGLVVWKLWKMGWWSLGRRRVSMKL